ncbi:2TM domain-containing protein [bacterium]|nr:2TM domain-containing protein [bacterium]
MNELSSKQYSKDEVDRIIRRALKFKKVDLVNHQELVDTAREFGIDPQTLEAAIEKEQESFAKEKARRTRLRRRKARFHRHLWSYIIVIGGLLLINIVTPGPWWFQWPALGWGIGLAFNFKAAYFPVQKDTASENGIIIP